MKFCRGFRCDFSFLVVFEMFLKGVAWDSLGRFLVNFSGVVFSVFLARLLTPHDFGVVAIAISVVKIGEVLVDAGLSSALIQKKILKKPDYTGIFIFQLSLGCILFFVCQLSAPLFARFFGYVELERILAVASVCFLFVAFSNVNRARVLRRVDFKKLVFLEVFSSFLAGGGAVIFALFGFGVWSLVFQVVIVKMVSTLLLWIYFPWKPSFFGCISAMRSFRHFGFYSSMSTVIRMTFSELDSMVLGKLFSSELLGFYSRAKSLRDMVVGYAGGSIARVFFSVVSRVEDRKFGEVYKTTIQVVSVISLLISGVMFVVADEFILLLFGDQWVGAVLFFKFLIVADGVTKPIGGVMLSALAGLGKVRLEFYMVLLKRTIWILCLFALYVYGVDVFLWSLIFHSIFVYIVDSWSIYICKKISIAEQCLFPALGYAFFGFSVYFVEMLSYDDFGVLQLIFLKAFIFSSSFFLLSFPFFHNFYGVIIKRILEMKFAK